MKILTLFSISAWTLAPLLAQSTISPTDKYAYSANAGWINGEANSSDGLIVAENLLSGYAYAANFGWIHFGNGLPNDGISYSNSSSSDYGVNHDGLGNLSGYAYSANTGWINFEQTHGQPRINLSDGSFSGYAYSANLGWLNLNTDLTTDTITYPDSDNDGIADHYERTHFGNLSTANATTNNDSDSQTDLEEYLANTDPEDSSDYLALCIDGEDQNGDLMLSYQAGLGRFLTLTYSADFDVLLNANPVTPTTLGPYESELTGDILIPRPTGTSGSPEDGSKHFFRLTATQPLQP